MRQLALITAALCAAAPLAAQQVPAERVQERVHAVRPGDTLWDIARLYLNDPLLWPEIFRLNTHLIRDPALIYPNERLRLPLAGIAVGAAPGEPERSIFYPRDEVGPQRELHTIRAAGTADIPVLTPGDFHRAGFIARDRDVASIGRLVERISPTVVPVEMPAHILLYDRIFVTLDRPDAARIGDRLHFFRTGPAVRRHGRIFQPTGIATVAAVDGNVATAVVVQLFDAMMVGDMVLPGAAFPVPAGVAPEPATGLQGSIIAFQSPHTLQGTQNIAFLDLGGESGVEEGDEFVAYLPQQRQRWGMRPEIEVARLQVVRVAGRTAAARVVALEHPALEEGVAVRLVAKMPQ